MTDDVQSTAAPIGALDINRVFRRTYGTFRRAPWLLVAIQLTTLAAIVAEFLAQFLPPPRGQQGMSGLVVVFVLLLVLSLIRWVVQIVAYGATVFASARVLGDETMRIGAALDVGFRRFFPVLAATILPGLVVALGLFVLVVPGFIAATALALVVPACVVERRGPIASIKRSLDLTRGNRWRVLAAACLSLLPLLGFMLLILLATIASVIASMDASTEEIVGWTIGWLVILFMFCVASPVVAVLSAVLHAELRRLKEGAIQTKSLVGVFE